MGAFSIEAGFKPYRHYVKFLHHLNLLAYSQSVYGVNTRIKGNFGHTWLCIIEVKYKDFLKALPLSPRKKIPLASLLICQQYIRE